MRKQRSVKPKPATFIPAIYIVTGFFLFAFFSACSSAPARTGEVFTGRDTAVKQLNLANQYFNRGHYGDALLALEEARRLAVSADDPSLRVKTSISRGNFLFALGREEEAFQEWERANAEGCASGDTVLAALARIYSFRAGLMLLAEDAPAGEAEDLKARLNRELVWVRSDPLATAAYNVTLGLAEKQLGRWDEAERALRTALDTHEKNFMLEDVAYDWFLIASVRSVAGNYDAALEALETAIRYDRQVENGYGLASSWRALGEVYLRAGKVEEARSAFSRAIEIYRAIKLDDRAKELENRLYALPS
jgi:tetratricopeptide (TPR) repeat protein